MLTLILTPVFLVLLMLTLAKLKLLPAFCYGLTRVAIPPVAYYCFNTRKQTLYVSGKPWATAKWQPLCLMECCDSLDDKVTFLRNAEEATTGVHKKQVTEFLTRIADRVLPGDGGFYHTRYDINFGVTNTLFDDFRALFDAHHIYSISLLDEQTAYVRFGSGRRSGFKATIFHDKTSSLLRLNSSEKPFVNYVGGCPFVFVHEYGTRAMEDSVADFLSVITQVFVQLERNSNDAIGSAVAADINAETLPDDTKTSPPVLTATGEA